MNKKDEKIYKKRLEAIYFNMINAFIPQYFSSENTEEDFYKEFKIELKKIFNNYFGEVEKDIFVNKVELLINSYNNSNSNSVIPLEYYDILKAKIIKFTIECLYDEPYSLIYYAYKNENGRLRNINEIFKNYDSAPSIYNFYKNKNLKFINLVKIKLQDMTENFGVKIIVANNIKWHEINEWVDKMNRILNNLSNEMNIPTKSLVNKDLTIICSNNYSFSNGSYIHQHAKDFIHITLNNLKVMSHIFIHEYTHFLDYKAGKFYSYNNSTGDMFSNLYISEYLLSKNIKESDKITTDMIIKTKQLLHHSLGIKDNNCEIIENKIENLKNQFYINLFKEININYNISSIEMKFLKHKGDDFFNNFFNDLLINIYDSPYNQYESSKLIYSEKYKKEISKLSINIIKYSKLINLNDKEAEKLVQALNNPVFINNFFKETKDFFVKNGIVKIRSGRNSCFVESTTDYIKKSLMTVNPGYWTNIIEIVARVVEDMHTAPVETIEKKKSFFNKFKKAGVTTIAKVFNDHDDSVKLLYPNKEMYDAVFEEKIKNAFKAMFNYIEHNEELKLCNDNKKKEINIKKYKIR